MKSPLLELNRIIRENRVDDFPTPNRALGMRPMEFAPGRSLWTWEMQPEATLNPFGTIQGGYLVSVTKRTNSEVLGAWWVIPRAMGAS